MTSGEPEAQRRASSARHDVTDLSAPQWDGAVHPAYDNPRPEVTPLVPPDARTLLDIGCSTGAMGGALRELGMEVVGIESDPDLAASARHRLDEVIEGDVEQLAAAATDLGRKFDCVVLADVLEHLRDPWAVVRWAAAHLHPSGALVISVPNIRHAETFWALAVRRRWPYKEVGIFDRSHLRFFARQNLPDLLTGTEFQIVELGRTFRLRPYRAESSWWNRVAPFLGDFGTLQFVFRAERRS